MQEPTAVSASLEDYDRSVASRVAAFICDPFIRWMFPASRQYLHHFPLVLKYFAGRAFEHSSAHRSADFRAAAMWLPPGVSPDEEALGAVLSERGRYTTLVASDIHRDGIGVELHWHFQNQDAVVAEVFLSDKDGSSTINTSDCDVPLQLVEEPVAEAKKRLTQGAA